MDKDVAAFVLVLLHSSTNTHLMHWQTDSYAKHKALGKYYDKIIDLADKFVECYQGKYKVITGYEDVYHVDTDPVKYMQGIKKYVEQYRKKLPQDTELQNIVDEIADLINSTLYKLRFLN
jgi:hypothetical protein